MKKSLASLVFLSLAMGCASRSQGATVFQDGFETGPLASPWSVSATNQGRVVVSTENGPATGAACLALDDSVSDALYSVAEATLTLDLANKKNVVLSFKAKSLGNEANPPPTGNFTTVRAYDGVAISTDGGSTWRSVQALDTVPSAWTSYSVVLDSSVTSLGGTFGMDFRIRFSAYDNAPVPIDGIAIDDVLVTATDDQRIVLELPKTLGEGTGPHIGYALLALPPAAPLTLSLSASPSGQLTLPATVTVEPGATYATFEFSVLDDSLVNLTRSITVLATATGATGASAVISVTDNDAPVATLTLPAQLTEGATPSANAMLSLDRAPTVAITLTLSASPTGELTLPSSVTVPAGQTQVAFTVRATDDTRIDGNVNVTVTAAASGLAPATATTTTIDNETRLLSMTLPATVSEGGSASGTVTLSGTLTSALDVTLASANEASLIVPATVTIAAGQTSASFTLAAPENSVRDGSRNVNITAAAAAFTGLSKSVTVRDNEVAGYRFGAVTGVVNLSSPLATGLSALDIEGNVIAAFAGSVNLSIVLPDESTQPLSPASVSLSGGSWSGSVTLPVIASAPLRLRATDSAGNFGETTSFDVMRALALPAADLVWDAARTRIYASVPASATGAYANKVVAIDPATLQIVGSVTTNQDPGRLALTNGGEALYAVLNGNGTIARIDPSTMTVLSTFAVGTDPSYGTLYAADICTVSGQPNLLIVSQYRKSVSPSHNGVAVYDNGVRRANKTQDHTGSNIIEPSADPTIYFGYNTESTEYGFRRLKLDANGMTQLEVNDTLFSGFYIDMRSAGDKVFSTSGVVVNGAQMKRLGTFGTSGLVAPDLASNRVFYLEPASSSSFDKITAYDPVTFSRILSLTLPTTYSSPASFIRWGAAGLAFRTSSTVYLMDSHQLVPDGSPANLAVSVQAAPNPSTVGAPLTYTVQVTNQGPNPAANTLLSTTLSDSQTIQTVTATVGTPATTGLTINLPLGNLASGATATLYVTTVPQTAGALSCVASATSNSVDPDFSNNSGSKLVGVGYMPGSDVVNQLRLTANNLVYDSTRKLLWTTIPATVAYPLGRSVVAVDPANGYLSDPIPINGNPMTGSMALSANGRYLYIGLSDVAEIHRIDLESPGYPSLRVPLGLNGWGDAGYAVDIEVLDGAGTSILATTSGDESALVIDGTVRRTDRTGIYTVNHVERTATPGIFIGYNTGISSFPLSRLSVTGSGVASIQTVNNLISYASDISGSGNTVLSSGGSLVNSSSLTLVSELGVAGRPCLDDAYARAFLVTGSTLRAFDAGTGAAAGSLTLPTTSTGDWALRCVRWGVDGFAILGSDKLYVARWSSMIPAGADLNLNGIADRWEAVNFGAACVSADDSDGDGIPNALEYLMGTSPTTLDVNPVQISATMATGASVATAGGGQPLVHVVFPRRKDVSGGAYAYECSTDLRTWAPPVEVTEAVLSTRTVDGIEIETVDATIPVSGSGGFFVRIVWLMP